MYVLDVLSQCCETDDEMTDDVWLGIHRRDGETWRECVARVAGAQGLANECLEWFDDDVAKGEEEHRAAWSALSEWDCLEIIPLVKYPGSVTH